MKSRRYFKNFYPVNNYGGKIMNLRKFSLAAVFSISILTVSSAANAADNQSFVSDMGRPSGYAAEVKPCKPCKAPPKYKKVFVKPRAEKTGAACPVQRPCPQATAPCPSPCPSPCVQPCAPAPCPCPVQVNPCASPCPSSVEYAPVVQPYVPAAPQPVTPCPTGGAVPLMAPIVQPCAPCNPCR